MAEATVSYWLSLALIPSGLCRSRLHGCAGVKTVLSSGWSRTSSWPFSSRTPWSSGLRGWMAWSPRSWNPTSTALPSRRPLSSSCSSGRFTGVMGEQLEGRLHVRRGLKCWGQEAFYEKGCWPLVQFQRNRQICSFPLLIPSFLPLALFWRQT